MTPTISNKNFVFHKIPAGKPDPKEAPNIVDGVDIRPRTVQHGTKTNGASHAAFNMLRQRVGQHPSVQSLPARSFEKLASQRRKNLPQLTKAMIPSLLGQLQPDENLVEAFYRLHKIPADTAFLQAAGADIQSLHKEMKDTFHAHGGAGWDQIPATDKAGFLEGMVRKVMIDKFELKTASWNPQQGIDGLHEALSKHGPLLVAGQFGAAFYKETPFKLKDPVEGVDIWGWEPNAARHADSATGGMVLLTACKKTDDGKSHVYFVDPRDESDPKDLFKKTYVISYENFVNRLIDLSGVFYSADRPESSLPSSQYLIYAPPRTATGSAEPATPAPIS